MPEERLTGGEGPPATDSGGSVPAVALAVAVAAAAAAGFVDAHLFLRVAQVFVANMSGNLIHLGMDLGRGDLRAVGLAGTALGVFVLGVVLATRRQVRDAEAAGVVRPSGLLVVEAALILGVLAVIEAFDLSSVSRHPATYVAVALGALAMGLQAATLRSVGRVAVSTTYGTGTVVRIGQHVASGGRARSGRGRSDSTRTVTVLSSVVAGYVVGAAIAAALGPSPWLLLVPIAVLLGCALVSQLAGVVLELPASPG